MDEDLVDIFDSSVSSLFSIPPIAFSTSSPTDIHTYNPPGSTLPVRLLLPHPPPALYTTLQANNLWLAGIYLADLISLDQLKPNVKGKRCCELGAGAGLPSVMAYRDGGAASVVCSDYDTEEVITVIEGNFRRAQEDAKDGRRLGDWAVTGHTWGTSTDKLCQAAAAEPRQFDVLFLSDVIWVTAAHKVLLDSVFSLLAADGVAHITCGLHTGRGPLERFITRVESRGASIEVISEARWKLEGGWETFKREEGGLEEERGVVVHLLLQRTTASS